MAPLNPNYPVPEPCSHYRARHKWQIRGLCGRCYGAWLHRVNPRYHKKQMRFNDSWYRNNRKTAKARRKRYLKALPKSVKKDRHLRWKFGISLSEQRAVLRWQKKRCKICGKPFTRKRKPHSDHNHLTEVFRGMLCGPCNHALGLFFDSPKLLRAAIRYLLTAEKAMTKFLNLRRRM